MTRRRLLPLAVAVALVGGAGCGGGPITSLRYRNLDPVWEVYDRRPIACPAERDAYHLADQIHDYLRRPWLDAMTLPEHGLADGINSLGEVPDSTWFENRIGVRDLSPADVGRGPNRPEAPDGATHWTILSSKEAGAAVGFFVTDDEGNRYLVKFDEPEAPELETTGDVAVARILWAAGYHVPENTIVYLDPTTLSLAPDATHKNARGEREELTQAELDATLSDLAWSHDGTRIRAMFSRLLDGVPVGGFPAAGVREDDPNDRIPHELRRDVRGQKAFFAWLHHTDVKEANTLDMWVEGEEPGKGYLVHYLLDFSKALGAWGWDGDMPMDGWAHGFDYGYAGASLVTFGLWRRPWEGVEPTGLPGVGRFYTDNFDPWRFRTSRVYAPVVLADRLDGYWASKIILRFERAHLDAAFAEARMSEPRSARYLVDTLLARGRRTARAFFDEVSPVDHYVATPEGEGYRLCGRDLGLVYDLGGDPRETEYEVSGFDFDGNPLFHVRRPGSPDGSVCVDVPDMPTEHDGYTLVAFEITERDGPRPPPSIAHLARHPVTARPRVIGIERL